MQCHVQPLADPVFLRVILAGVVEFHRIEERFTNELIVVVAKQMQCSGRGPTHHTGPVDQHQRIRREPQATIQQPSIGLLARAQGLGLLAQTGVVFQRHLQLLGATLVPVRQQIEFVGIGCLVQCGLHSSALLLQRTNKTEVEDQKHRHGERQYQGQSRNQQAVDERLGRCRVSRHGPRLRAEPINRRQPHTHRRKDREADQRSHHVNPHDAVSTA